MNHVRLETIAEREPVPGCRARFVHSDHMTIAYWTLEPGAVIPEHAHPHEQVANMIEGTFELTVDGETRELTPGSVVVIPSQRMHAGRAKTRCRIIDVFHPVREDYR